MPARSSTVSSTGVLAVRARAAGAGNGFQPSPAVATRARAIWLFPPIQIGTRAGLGFTVWPLAVNVVPSKAKSSVVHTPRSTASASSNSTLRCSKSTPRAAYSARR